MKQCYATNSRNNAKPQIVETSYAEGNTKWKYEATPSIADDKKYHQAGAFVNEQARQLRNFAASGR
jgi:hypothetical protein